MLISSKEQDNSKEQDKINFYGISKALKLSLEITKILNNSDYLLDIFKYSSIIDNSERGFDCTNAMALLRSIKAKETDPKNIKVSEKLFYLLEEFHQLFNLTNEEIFDTVMDKKN